jgi:hypothetical protein
MLSPEFSDVLHEWSGLGDQPGDVVVLALTEISGDLGEGTDLLNGGGWDFVHGNLL